MKFKMTPQEALCELDARLGANVIRDIAHFIVWYVEDLISAKRLNELNEFIGIVNPAIDTHASSCILRSSYSHSQSLTNWLTFLSEVREAHIDNPRINRILVGLDKPYTQSYY